MAGAPCKYPRRNFGYDSLFTYVGNPKYYHKVMGALPKRPDFGGGFLPNRKCPPFISCIGQFNIGRWTGAIGAFDLPNHNKK